MQYSDLQQMFNRAADRTLNRSKWLLTSGILSLCGLLVLFFQALALKAGDWLAMSALFLPIFLCGGVLLSLGIVLIRAYHHEIKQKEFTYKELLKASWKIVLGAAYFCVPILLIYLLMWVLMGFFLLLKAIPLLGGVFGVLFVFAPFLLNLGSLILCLLSAAILFFITPLVALRSIDPVHVSQVVMERVRRDLFGNVLVMLIALLPLACTLILLSLAVSLTGTFYLAPEGEVSYVLSWFLIMIPFIAVLSPSIIFFFNFAAEGHVKMRVA